MNNKVTDSLSSPIENILNKFKIFSENGFASEPNWLKTIRENSLKSFQKLGFPSQKNEEWRYTNINSITKLNFETSSNKEFLNYSKQSIYKYIISDSYYLVFVNGKYLQNLSNPPKEEGVIVNSIKDAIKLFPSEVENYFSKNIDLEANSFAALNTSLFDSGVFIKIKENVILSKPIELIYISQNQENIPQLISPRNIIVIKNNASLDFVEQFVTNNSNKNLTNIFTEIYLDENSICNYLKIQNEVDENYHIANISVSQKTSSKFFSFAFSAGSSISRNQMALKLFGENSDTNMNGLYISTAKQLIDNHTFIEHTQPNCTSREVFKGILYDNSHSVFNGKVYVHSAAQKTDSKQTNNNLLLSDNATIDTKPQLEIFADDVKCTHGGTVGGIDANALFYLKSRGISPKSAEALFALGFASAVTETIENLNLRRFVDNLVVSKLEKCHGNISLPIIAHYH
ncbi:MAG: Fe-S cluster assembly protein SufD [Bacteroidetes bacterium]|nr:Fe-S cluster assembly protein SufD [Bacteroidota bacterium]